jgi:hypothetical protein
MNSQRKKQPGRAYANRMAYGFLPLSLPEAIKAGKVVSADYGKQQSPSVKSSAAIHL